MLSIKTLRINLSIFVILLFVIISNVGCSSKTKDSLSYETQVHKVQYTFVDCGDLKLNNLNVKLEDPTQSAGSLKNQEIVTHNLIILDYKLKEAESLLKCYKVNYKKLQEEVSKN